MGGNSEVIYKLTYLFFFSIIKARGKSSLKFFNGHLGRASYFAKATEARDARASHIPSCVEGRAEVDLAGLFVVEQVLTVAGEEDFAVAN